MADPATSAIVAAPTSGSGGFWGDAWQRLRAHRAALDVDHHDVRLHVREIDVQAGDVRQELRKRARIRVILDEACTVVLEREQARRSEDAGLAHAATLHLAQPMAGFDQRLRPADE